MRVTPIGDNQWYEIANYLNYKMNDCWSLGGRFEWFQDPEGARVSPGCRGNYWEMTAGINYKPHANVTIRPEIRYDWFDSFAGNTVAAFQQRHVQQPIVRRRGFRGYFLAEGREREKGFV